MVPNNLAIGNSYVQLLDVAKDYNAVAHMMADNFTFVSPKLRANSKDEWLARFPDMHQKAPIFQEFVEGTHARQVVRKGTKKMGFANIPVKEILEFDNDGKIERITAKLGK